MKNFIASLLIISMSCISVFSQVISNCENGTNKAIQQIRNAGIENIMKYQIWNLNANDYVLLKQFGVQNKANIKQSQTSYNEMNNQSYSIQSGNSNELSIEQTGTGNILLSFQMGYLSSKSSNNSELKNDIDFKTWPLIHNNENEYLVEGEKNKMNFAQNGNNNSVRAIQQGSNNSISATQQGNFNNLLMIQKGVHNSINDYKQQNISTQILFDKIIQLGENNSLETAGAINGGMLGNNFTQIGTNLSLELNNELLNTTGGVEITQKGTEMKVVIEQSYFSFPMK